MIRLAALWLFSIGVAIWVPVEVWARSSYGSGRFGTGPMPCRWKTLQSQGFGDPVGKGVTLRFIGTVPGRTRPYYLYHWDFVNPETIHGRQSILVLQYRCRYVGQYFVMAEPSHIVKDTLFFRAPKEWGNKLRFSKGLLPRQAWINGEVHDLIR